MSENQNMKTRTGQDLFGSIAGERAGSCLTPASGTNPRLAALLEVLAVAAGATPHPLDDCNYLFH